MKDNRSPKVYKTKRGQTEHPKEKQGFAVGDRVTHSKFGDGKVMSVRDYKITVQFTKQNTKEILDIFLKRRA